MTGFTCFIFFSATMVSPELDGRVLAFYKNKKLFNANLSLFFFDPFMSWIHASILAASFVRSVFQTWAW